MSSRQSRTVLQKLTALCSTDIFDLRPLQSTKWSPELWQYRFDSYSATRNVCATCYLHTALLSPYRGGTLEEVEVVCLNKKKTTDKLNSKQCDTNFNLNNGVEQSTP
jgi:hypothetical protein